MLARIASKLILPVSLSTNGSSSSSSSSSSLSRLHFLLVPPPGEGCSGDKHRSFSGWRRLDALLLCQTLSWNSSEPDKRLLLLLLLLWWSLTSLLLLVCPPPTPGCRAGRHVKALARSVGNVGQF